jgi:membrane protein DedA with SNARE-associated domain
VEWLTSIDGWVIYVAIGLLALGESAAFLGLALPGELALVAAGASAALGWAHLGLLLTVVVSAATVGAAVGYWIGRRWGASVLEWPPVRRRLGSARQRVLTHLAEKGGLVVVLSRFNPVTRALVPPLAGSANMPVRRFVLATGTGAVVWSGAVVVTGYVAASALAAPSMAASVAAVVALPAIGYIAVRGYRKLTRGASLAGVEAGGLDLDRGPDPNRGAMVARSR